MLTLLKLYTAFSAMSMCVGNVHVNCYCLLVGAGLKTEKTDATTPAFVLFVFYSPENTSTI